MGTKGGGFEWDVARSLSLWLTKDEDDGQLVRSRSSGAWATQRRKRGKSGVKTQLGDLAAAGPDVAPLVAKFLRCFFVECKAYKGEPNLWALFRCDDEDCKAKLVLWWIKASEQASAASARSPLLIMRRNYQPTLIASPFGLTLSAIKVGVHWGDYDLCLEPFDALLEMDPEEAMRLSGYAG